MRILFEIVKIAVGVFIGAVAVAFFNLNFHISTGQHVPHPVEMAYADLASINLTVATVVLGGVALIVAVAAVFGFQVIRREAVTNAEARVKADLPTLVDKELRKMEKDGRLKNALERVIYSGGFEDADGDLSQQQE